MHTHCHRIYLLQLLTCLAFITRLDTFQPPGVICYQLIQRQARTACCSQMFSWFSAELSTVLRVFRELWDSGFGPVDGTKVRKPATSKKPSFYFIFRLKVEETNLFVSKSHQWHLLVKPLYCMFVHCWSLHIVFNKDHHVILSFKNMMYWLINDINASLICLFKGQMYSNLCCPQWSRQEPQHQFVKPL